TDPALNLSLIRMQQTHDKIVPYTLNTRQKTKKGLTRMPELLTEILYCRSFTVSFSYSFIFAIVVPSFELNLNSKNGQLLLVKDSYMAIFGIVAISRNYAIGKDGKLPWHYPADLKFFKKTTTGNAVVMGANTWRSIGRSLPDRLNIVLTRSGDIGAPPDVMNLSSVAEVVDLAQYLN